ncbi:glucose 1-dehydrogenase [Oceanibacterium hippocampi]|uniref:4-formylbenzenesulfonate dehydrogenase TsaC1/TsaC2 n=1 Tax=Oceanibacterium hippocampi TaxID=745714 RepID=A0A1Y5T3X0_9PROT|nr:glucose 1-dehydrogenase [Oceanibacterium hippocampi]SLN55176.1 4-formylbenzenesulfonate dehydrogenase TsaC1/TsaC2 [Oceanibacterium hippocampi]
MRLKGKVAIVTGAGSGFGEGIARRFAREGAHVVVCDMNAEAAERVAATLRSAGGSATASATDVTDGAAIQAMVDRTVAEQGGLDIMVNNAGVPQRNGPMLDVPEEVFDRIFEVNVKSIYLTSKAVVPALRKRGGGAIINTASTAALSPRPGLTWYNASKGAVVTMTKSMAVELAADQIRVTCLCPVVALTGMTAEFMGGSEKDTPEMRAKFLATIPLGRMSTPEDLANAALYLASDEAAFITGVALEVDGGRCI